MSDVQKVESKIWKVWMWIVQAGRDIFDFCYKEIGTLLSLLKYPVQGTSPVVFKYSSKRLLAVSVAVGVIRAGIPQNWYHVVVDTVSIIVAGGLLWYAMKTKT